MNRLKIWIAFLLAGAMLVPAGTRAEGTATPATPDKMAVVNDTVITRGEFDRELNQFKDRIASQGRQIPENMLGEIEKNILDKLIDRELLYQESQKKKIAVDEAAISEQFDRLKGRYADPARFAVVLKQMNSSEGEVRTLIAKSLAIRGLIQKELEKDLVVSAAESRQFYDAHPDYFTRPERVHASHILVKQASDADEAAKAAARKKIETAQKRLADGEDFAAVAREVSEGPSASQGGDLGFFSRGQMVKPFEEAAFTLAPGTVSDVVTTRFGLHLIRVAEKKPEETVSYEEAKDKIVLSLTNQKRQEALSTYLEKLRKGAAIQKYL